MVAFFVFKRKVFDYLEEDDNCDLEYGTLEELAELDQLRMYKHEGFWAPMDAYRDYEYLNKMHEQGLANWQSWRG